MKYEKRTQKNGSSYYSFVHYDSKTDKRLRLTKEEVRKRFGKDILTQAEAKECLVLLEAQYESEKVRIQRRLSWEAEYYNFTGLLESYAKAQKKKAPNSWENNVFYIKHFFLTKKKLNNVELWEDSFEEFKDWLEKDAKLVRGKGIISFSSKNHAIKSLNTFMKLLHSQKLVTRLTRCDAFAEHLQNARTIDDVVHPKEVESVYKMLIEQGHKMEASFFRYLYFSGMRFSEGIGISLADLFQGELPENQLMAKKIKMHKIKYHGYIVADSQIDNKGKRWPFKGKKEISEKHSRTIPIVDKILWNELVELASGEYERLGSGNKKDAFLFRGIDATTSSRRLEAAFQSCKLKYRTWHCLRHSRATWLIGETGDEILAKAWLGHSSQRVFERYNHMYQSLVREAKAKDTVGKEFKLKKV
jgi:integrase